MAQPMFGDHRADPQSIGWRDYLTVVASMLVCGGLVTGCVSSEKFEAEKARSLNFQRLLAQEEKRTGELNVKYQDLQRQVASMQSQNRDLNAELEALRDQLNRTQDELSRVREGDMGTSEDLKLSEPSISEFGLEDLDFKDSDLAKLDSDLNLEDDVPIDSFMSDTREREMAETREREMAETRKLDERELEEIGLHTVTKGETLYRISKEYGVSVQDLKDWNNLSDNTIHIGQKLIVSGR